jgi:predicted PurR-regulated permease PerM
VDDDVRERLTGVGIHRPVRRAWHGGAMSNGSAPSPYNWDETRVPRWFPRALAYILAAAAIAYVARAIIVSLNEFLVMLLVSLFVSFAVEPAVDWMAARGWRRGPATALVFVILTVISAALVWLVVSLVVDQVTSLVGDAPRLIRKAADSVNQRFGTKITTDSVVEQVKKYQSQLAVTASDLGGRVISVTGSVVGVVFQFFTIALFSFYLVADAPKVRKTVCSVLPPDRQRIVLRLWEIAIEKTGGYLYSRLLLASVSASVASIGFSMLGTPSPVALGLWMGVVSQFVPVIGTYIGGALPLLVVLLNSPIKALWVLIFLIVYQQLENYFLAPRVTSKTMAIHPAVAFGAVLIGAQLIGPLGALLALPAAAIVQAFVSTYIERYDVVALEENQVLPTEL